MFRKDLSLSSWLGLTFSYPGFGEHGWCVCVHACVCERGRERERMDIFIHAFNEPYISMYDHTLAYKIIHYHDLGLIWSPDTGKLRHNP